MNREQRIQQKLSVLNPTRMQLKNVSEKHAGHIKQHLGDSGHTGETHYELLIVCDKFKDMSRVDRQRAIMDLLRDEFSNGLHALQIKARAEGEV